MNTATHSLADLPVEVPIDNVLPAVDLADLGSLAAASKFMSVICADDTFWKRKCLEDFNFSGGETARRSGWKLLYRGLFRPKIFVWGYVKILACLECADSLKEDGVTDGWECASFQETTEMVYLTRSSSRSPVAESFL